MKLAQLLWQKPNNSEWCENVVEIAIDEICPGDYQPRKEFEFRGLEELACSIKEHGILHPVVVRRSQMGYELIVGERRLRACKMLNYSHIPAVVRDLSDDAAAQVALIENIQRRDLSFFEEAEGYRRLIDEFHMTQEGLAEKVGRSQSGIANRLRLLKLEPAVRQRICQEMLSERHARALLSIPDADDRLKMVDRIVKHSLNVKQTEEIIARVANIRGRKASPGKKLILKDLRLFTNSIRSLVGSLKNSGLTVEVEECDENELYQVTVLIMKPDRGE